jgi:thiamine biosynthesis lipoprotein
MGTTANISLPQVDDLAFRESMMALERVNRRLTAFDSGSSLGQLNASRGEWLYADVDLVAVAEAAVRFRDLTGGAFDPSVLSAMRRLGFVPGDAGSETATRTPLDVDGSRVRIGTGGQGLDFGGIAKGYGVDQSIRAMKERGHTDGLVEAGGDLMAIGSPDGAKPWFVGVRDPLKPSELFARLTIRDEGVATSGSYLQRRTVGGLAVSHLLDPATGLSVEPVLSATIVAPDAMTADAVATAAAIMDPSAARDLVESLPGVEGLWVLLDRSVSMTSGMAKRTEFA